MTEFDIVIAGGTVVDGTGTAGQAADVGIVGDRIAAIGPGLKGTKQVDASGCVVAPGFIDIHTHYDAQVFWDPALTPSSFHGVTTVVAGNCGFTIAPTDEDLGDLIARTLERVEDMDVEALRAGIPHDFRSFPEYLESVARRGVGLNYACYLGHTPLRLAAMRSAAYERAATDEERAEMIRLVHEAMEAGAAGFSSSFAPHHFGADGLPVPSRFSDRQELEEILAAVASHDRGIASFAPGPQFSETDLYEIQPRVGIPFTYGALVSTAANTHVGLLELHHSGLRDGIDVWPQVTPRPISFSVSMANPYTMNLNAEFRPLMTASVDERRAAYSDPAWRARALDAWARQDRQRPRWETFEVSENPSHPENEGHFLVDLAAGAGREPFDHVLDLALEEPDLELRVRSTSANDDKDVVAKLLVEDHCTLGLSDAGAHVGQLCDASQATDLLANWVRDRGVMSLETAVRRLSGLQADIFNFTDRGYLRTGGYADVVVFDPDTVAPGPTRRVRDFPANSSRLTADRPIGIRHVFVNGTAIRKDEVALDLGPKALPGHVIAPAKRA